MEAIVEKENSALNRQVDFELNEMQFKMIKLGGITNIVSGFLVVWILKAQIQWEWLIGWYIALIIVNVINILFSYIYKFAKVTPEQIKPWLHTYHLILIFVCLAWGSIGVLFTTDSIQIQLYIIAFLLAVLVGFGLGTISDFVASVISISCLLLPYIVFHTWSGINSLWTTGSDPNLNLALSFMLLILGSFLLICCFIGSRLLKRSYILTFENIALNHKLENMNAILEQRVKERTAELEKSLNLVTYQATHDLLTDLPNQRMLVKYLQGTIKNVFEKNGKFAVVFFSLNELEKINDGLGHRIGDLVIRTIAQRLQQKLKSMENGNHYTVTLSRKDVFVIIVEPIDLEEIENKIKVFFSTLDEPIATEKQVLKLTASVGVSIYPRDGKGIKSLMMNADLAMMEAKQIGGNSISIFNENITTDIPKEIQIETNLHNALSKSEFLLQYQPFVDLKNGKIVGAEALVRWNNPTLGFISPDNFIPLAEANGIILPLGEWVLRTACEQTKRWHDDGFDFLKVAVNISAKQLFQRNIVKIIVNILQETNLKPESIELELTETEAFKPEFISVLQQFKELGFGLSVDDFGTGYSGLTNLKLFSIDKLKIDKIFVQDITTNNESRAIVTNTISLAKKMNIVVLAEGVETKEQLDFLKENGCDLIQGYFFSPPVYADVFTNLLESHTKFRIDPE